MAHSKRQARFWAAIIMSLSEQFRAKTFEHQLSLVQTAYYALERKISEIVLRRPPPGLAGPRLLNLGCGPHIYPGWVNADDYALKRRLREKSFRPNWFLDITRPWRCPDNYWEGIFTEHVIEHISYSQAVHVFAEAFRTLQPGAWIRISVPSLRRYIAYYNGDPAEANIGDIIGHFPHPAVALSFLTQMHQHKSAWDESLMVAVLAEAGFQKAAAVSFGKGSDSRLLRDDASKQGESQYVEAQKPRAAAIPLRPVSQTAPKA